MNLYFKTLFTTLMPFVIGFFTCYLVGSFVSVSFDPVMWTIEARSFTALCGFVWGGGLYCKLMFEGLV